MQTVTLIGLSVAAGIVGLVLVFLAIRKVMADDQEMMRQLREDVSRIDRERIAHAEND